MQERFRLFGTYLLYVAIAGAVSTALFIAIAPGLRSAPTIRPGGLVAVGIVMGLIFGSLMFNIGVQPRRLSPLPGALGKLATAIRKRLGLYVAGFTATVGFFFLNSSNPGQFVLSNAFAAMIVGLFSGAGVWSFWTNREGWVIAEEQGADALSQFTELREATVAFQDQQIDEAKAKGVSTKLPRQLLEKALRIFDVVVNNKGMLTNRLRAAFIAAADDAKNMMEIMRDQGVEIDYNYILVYESIILVSKPKHPLTPTKLQSSIKRLKGTALTT